MKYRRLILVVILVLVAAVGWRTQGSPETGTGTLTLPQPAPNEGEAAPNFTTELLGGSEFRLSDKGTYVLAFWSRLNQGSARSQGEFAELARAYPDGEATFVAVYVSNVTREDREDAPYAVVQDSTGKLTSLYNVNRVPRTFLVHDGRIVLVQNGFYKENEQKLREAMQEIAAEET